MNFRVFFYLIIFLSSKLFSQSVCALNNSPEENFYYCLTGYTSISATDKAQWAVNAILSKTGIPDANFVVKGCNSTQNASAIIYNNTRYIFIDEPYVNWLSPNKSDWNYIFILAHEIGHHLNGHTLTNSRNLAEQRKRELESDKFAGFVIKKFGGTKDDIYSSLNLIPHPKENNTSHPILSDRLRAANEGFDMALEEEVVVLNAYKTYLESYYKKRFYEIDLYRARLHKVDYFISADDSYLDESLNYYLKVIGENQADSEIYLELSDLYFYKKDYYNSMLYADKGYSISRNPIQLIFAYSRCSDVSDSNIIKSGACDKYIEELKLVDYRKLNDPEPIGMLGKFYGNIGDDFKAETLVKLAIDKILSKKTIDFFDSVYLSDLYNDLSVAQLRQKKINSAYENLLKSIKISEENKVSGRYYNYFVEMNETNERIQLVNKAILENLLEKWNESNKTCEKLKKEKEYFQNICYYLQGENYQNLGDYTKAIENYDLAIKYENDVNLMAKFYYLRGLSKISNGDRNGGCSDLMISKDKGNNVGANKYKMLCDK